MENLLALFKKIRIMMFILFLVVIVLQPLTLCQEKKIMSCTVPITLDHNRMLVDAEIQRKDGTWRKARLWVDTGNPDFFISESLAQDLGIDLKVAKEKVVDGEIQPFKAPLPTGVRIGGMLLNFTGVNSQVIFQPEWLFSTMHNDGNLPSTVLKHYQIVFDYPGLKLTLAEPGSLKPRGDRASASINSKTGIVQIDAVIDGDSLSLAMDNGASYSFVSDDLLERFSQRHPNWQRITGAIGCANIWGWWPEEEKWPVMRLPEIQWGSIHLADVGIVGLPKFFPNGAGLGDWYSQKTARPVDGILGPNAYMAFRVEIDYVNGAVYFEKGAGLDSHDLDIVGLTLRPMTDGSYFVIGVARKNGKPTVEDVEPGDKIIQIGELKATGATMGTVVDALKGKPGDIRILVLERKGKQFKIEAKVERFL
jgi:hypothetical protein